MRGSIVKKILKNGEPSYHYVVWIGDKQIWRGAGSNKKDAERLLAERITEINSGTYTQPQKILFREFAEKWLQDYAFVVVKDSTFRLYRSAVKNHIRPELGHYPVPQITARIVQQFLSSLLKAGKTPKTVNNVLVLLKTMLKHACEWGYAKTNPTSTIKQFRVEHQEMDFLELHEIQLLLKYSDEPFRTIFLTAVLTGMRRGEIFALQWQDIDWNSSRIFVRRSLYWQTNDEMAERKNVKRWKFVSPKTERSCRTIVMSPILKKALQIHRISSPVSELDLVFCNKKGNPLDPDNLVKREFHTALDRAGLRRIRFHDLRHTYTSILISKNFNIKFIQSQVGHASIVTTIDRYGHLFQIDNEGAGKKIDEIFYASNKNLTDQADKPHSIENNDEQNFSIEQTQVTH